MKSRNLVFICLSALLVLVTGCSAPSGAVNSDNSSTSNVQSSEPSSSAQSKVLESSSSQPASSENAILENTSSKTKDNSKWVAYTTNKDSYKLHIKKEDGTEDKIIVDDTVLAPCVAGEWVYYLADLSTIERVRLDGSEKSKVCDTDSMDALSANSKIVAEYKDGYILYTLTQLKEQGENSSNFIHCYKLDLNKNKITLIKNS
ncbi:hypothetical protein CAFE_28240 [Caprobacter fermentans]|uniref:Prolow-density lipoprotein receptor-related protein 1-like beta-propeller domain-containing protein n=1 Tax=Caproicibacter fermentans TaxID=2576756 RepID=A0A6N8I3K8_9FIRM|nr:DUF5050 domain-containing protein [Caproicibacter fermentans]MVB12093.1 hypothetical protein [Caproicibacter fermentans]